VPIKYRFAAKQAASALVDELLINVNGPDPITDDTWMKYVAWSEKLPNNLPCAFTFSPFHSPNARQRNILIEQIQRKGWNEANVAIVTQSSVVRGAITVFSWFVRIKNKAFSPSETVAAIDWCQRQCRFDRAEVKRFLGEAILEVGFSDAQRRLWLPS
jgi:hypothetical protein